MVPWGGIRFMMGLRVDTNLLSDLSVLQFPKSGGIRY